MSAAREMRVELVPLGGADWQVRLMDSGDQSGPVKMSLAPETLKRLRTNPWNPDTDFMRDTGTAVWSRVMQPFVVESLDTLKAQGADVRLVFVFRGTITNGRPAMEMPLEGLYDPDRAAYLMVRGVSISRSLQSAADLDPVLVARPLRILIMAATPSDKPQSAVDEEIKAISESLKANVDAGMVQLSIVTNATIALAEAAIAKTSPHILHFIGHGGAGSINGDGASVPYVCFEEDPPRTHSKLVTAQMFLNLLRAAPHHVVNVVIFTSCTSAGAPEPPGTKVGFDGMAQQLIQNGDVLAAVAMQFDLEDWAAPVFSSAFYESLATHDLSLDECVRRGRVAVMHNKTESWRAWMCPVVYSRCKDGVPFRMTRTSSPIAKETDVRMSVMSRLINDAWASSPDVTQLGELLNTWVDTLNGMGEILATELREFVRVAGAKGAARSRVVAELRLHTDMVSLLNFVSVRVEHPGLRLVDVQAGADNVDPPTFRLHEGASTVTCVAPAGTDAWPGGNRELARLHFEPTDASGRALSEITLNAIKVSLGGQFVACHTAPGWVCLI